MDYIPAMFQFDQTTDHELFPLISTFPCKLDQQNHDHQRLYDYHHHEIQKDHQVHPPTPPQDGRDLTHKRQRSSSAANFGENDHDQNPNDTKKKKKLIHREIERQRRKETAALIASLRSHIPLEYLKGKRSTSDQMHGAANYIKDLKRKIQELSGKRDELNRVSDSISSLVGCCSTDNIITSDHDQNSKQHNSETKISVRHCRAGVEVVVNTAFKQGLPLSSVLRVLAGEGLTAVSCVSAKVNRRFLHTIESEIVSGERSMDLPELEQKLKELTT